MIIVNEKLLDEFRTPGRCEWCGGMCKVREPHHVSAKGMGGGKRLDIRCNLLSVGSTDKYCCPCHRAIHQTADKLRREIVLKIVAEREKTTPETIQECVWLFQRTPKIKTVSNMVEASQTVSDEARLLFVRECGLAVLMGALTLGD